MEAIFFSLLPRLSTPPKRKFSPKPHDYTHLILDGISIGLVKDKKEAQQLLSYCSNQSSKSLEEILVFLRHNQLIGSQGEDDILAITQLGSAISSSFLTPSEGIFLFKQLKKAHGNFDLRCDMQMLYLVTPIASRIGFKNLNLANLFKYYESLLTVGEKESLKKLGISNASCLKFAFGHTRDDIHSRFFLTLVLRELMNRKVEHEIMKEFNLDVMQLELLKTQTIVYLRTVISMTDQLGWSYLNMIMRSFGQKLEISINPDVTDLIRLLGVDGMRALAFVERGIESISQLATTDPMVIESLLRHSVAFTEGERTGDNNEWLQGQITDCKTAVKRLIQNAHKILQDNDINVTLEASLNESEDSDVDEPTICSMIDKKRSCLENLTHHAKFIVLDVVDGRLQILNDKEDYVELGFSEAECAICDTSTTEELEKLFISEVNVFAKDLSLLFYQCRSHFLQVSYVQEHDTSFLKRFHCVSSLMRVRNKNLEATPEGIQNYLTSVLTRFHKKNIRESPIFLLCRLIKNVILEQKISDHVMKLTRLWNESVHTAVYMSYYGIQIDLEMVDRLRASLHKLMTLKEEQVWKMTNQKFNLYKVSSTRKVLEERGIMMDHVSKAPGTIDELNQTDNEVARLIVNARNAYTAHTQIEAIASHCDMDGRVRSFYNTLSHITGRIGLENPPIQMLIKKQVVDEQSARSIFVAKEGCTLISADFSQLELRMILAMSGDDVLARLVEKNVDPFEYLSDSLRNEGIQIDRDTAKKLFYSVVYGVGSHSLSAELNVDVRKAERILLVFSQVFKGVDKWLRKVTQTALDRGCVSNIWSLGIGLDGMRQSEAKRRIPNYIIQSSVTYVFRVALNNVMMSLPNSMGGLVLQIHDELICEVRSDCVDECVELIKRLMETSLLGVHFPVSIKVGPNWGQMKKLGSVQ
ncbi:unnamed protein product [Bursaphelenchus okinawaensis]|uniref:DNA-directed DNA polymerase family A palm domain-containing protein n=1 Tax=Bursaphelenchus okinawaensis TaxID=465554 RepID=A0A811KKW0_9BILA|nr:unnamed protein product [Bursaphelenchus okinawaensis]CAG9104649.1 unnamed protein product [Bursaphelenchus okinawaensis]